VAVVVNEDRHVSLALIYADLSTNTLVIHITRQV
jgi:hypothetical protein